MVKMVAQQITNNVAYYKGYKYNSIQRLHDIGNMHGVKRVVIFCLMTAILPTVLIITPLYLRHSIFADVTYPVAESDVVAIMEGISSVFCESQSLKMNTTFNAFQLRKSPTLSKKRKHIRLKKSMTLPDDTLEYWGFYLLKGATVFLKVCSRYEGSRILVVRGEKNLNTCGLLEHNFKKFGATMDQDYKQVKVTFEHAQEIDDSRMAGDEGGNNAAEDVRDYDDGRLAAEDVGDYDDRGLAAEDVRDIGISSTNVDEKTENMNNDNVDLKKIKNDDNNENQVKLDLKDDEENHFNDGKIFNPNYEERNGRVNLLDVENEVKRTREKLDEVNTKANFEDDVETTGKVNLNNDEEEREENLLPNDNLRPRKVVYNNGIAKRKLNPDDANTGKLDSDNLKVETNNNGDEHRHLRRHSKKYLTKMEELYKLQRALKSDEDIEMRVNRRRRNKRDLNQLNQLDGGIEHGGNAFNYSRTGSNENSVSSFETDLLTCYDGSILLTAGFNPSDSCTEVRYLELGEHIETVHEVASDGYYYYIFYSDNDFISNDIHAIFDIYKPTYQYQNNTKEKECVNVTECNFPIEFLSDETVIVEIPTQDGIEKEEDTIALLVSTCHPRMSVYLFFPIAVIFLILGCSFL